MKGSDALLIRFDHAGDDNAVLSIGRKDSDEKIQVVNEFHGKEAEDLYKKLINKNQPKPAVRINLNDIVKFKLTDHGKDIYYHRFDAANQKILKRGGKPIEPSMPKVDSEGYTKMQLWCFIELFGPHTSMTAENYIEHLEIIYEEQ